MTMILKLGGSLMDNGGEILRFLSDYAETKSRSFVIVPGGGPFAEVVRKLSEKKTISDDTAHWMAVLAMHQYGLFLAGNEPEIKIPVAESMEELNNADPISIILPYKLLKDDDSLPHTWDVTSDTIAAFIAHKLGEKTFVKLTDVDGILDENGLVIKQIHAKELVAKVVQGCVDAELPRFLLRHKMSCTIINGNVPERIIDVIEGRETICTKLVSHG
jgi:aspartokinase-like uncharacterized kinase